MMRFYVVAIFCERLAPYKPRTGRASCPFHPAKKIWDIPASCHSVQCQYHCNSKLTILSLLFDQKQSVATVIKCVGEINLLKSFHILLYFLNACQNDAQHKPTCIQGINVKCQPYQPSVWNSALYCNGFVCQHSCFQSLYPKVSDLLLTMHSCFTILSFVYS